MRDIANDASLEDASIDDLTSLENLANQFRIETGSLTGLLDPDDIFAHPTVSISSQGTLPAPTRIRTSVTYTNSSTSGAVARDGHVAQVRMGVQFPVSQNVALGAILSLSDGDNDSTALATTLDSRKVGITTTAKIALLQDTLLSFAASYVQGEHDISITGFTGSFDTNTLAGSARIERRFQTPGGWAITPRLTTSYASVDRSTYVNTAARTVVGATEHLGLMQGAVRLDKAFKQGGLVYAPWFELGADWLYEKPLDAVLLDGTVLSTNDTGLSLGGGVQFVIGTRASGFVSTTYRHSGKSESWSLDAGFKHEF